MIVSHDGFLRQPLHIFCSFFTLYDTVFTGPVKQVSPADKHGIKTFKHISENSKTDSGVQG